jgi:tetrahydromethanopterin S-methyltransferase subunit B
MTRDKDTETQANDDTPASPESVRERIRKLRQLADELSESLDRVTENLKAAAEGE